MKINYKTRLYVWITSWVIRQLFGARGMRNYGITRMHNASSSQVTQKSRALLKWIWYGYGSSIAKLSYWKVESIRVAFEDQWVPSLIDTLKCKNDAEFSEEHGYIFLCMFIWDSNGMFVWRYVLLLLISQ